MRQKKEKQSVTPFSKMMIVILLAVGSVLILVESLPILREYLPEKNRQEPEQVHYVQETTGESVLPAETVDMPTETQTVEEITLETAAEPTAEANVSAEPASYEIKRWDQSYDDGNGYTLEYYYDYVQLDDNGPASKKINEQLYAEAEIFMRELTREQIETPILSVYGTVEDGILTMNTEVTHNGRGFVSLQFSRNYYMGGNHSTKTVSAATYSLKTGEEVGLAEIFPDMDKAQMKQMLADIVFQAVTGYVYDDSAMLDSIYQMLCDYTLESFEFLIRDGEVQLLFKPGLYVGGPYGPKLLPTGLRIE